MFSTWPIKSTSPDKSSPSNLVSYLSAKGEKVYWNNQAFEDLSMLTVGFAPVMESVDYHWEIFLWGDPPIHPLCDFDLSVPNTWFEYECEFWQEMNILEDQVSLPESKRRFPVPRNPNAQSTLFHSQEKLQKIDAMRSSDWYPEDTKYNIYNQKNRTDLLNDLKNIESEKLRLNQEQKSVQDKQKDN